MDSGYYCLTDGVCRGRPGLDDSWGVDVSGCATGVRRASMWATEVSTFMQIIEIIECCIHMWGLIDCLCADSC